MVACKEEASAEGTYNINSDTAGGETYEIGDNVPAMVIAPTEVTLTADFMTIELKKGGSATIKNYGQEQPDATITWSQSGNTITITTTYDGQEPYDQEATLNGNDLTMVSSSPAVEVTYVFKKA